MTPTGIPRPAARRQSSSFVRCRSGPRRLHRGAAICLGLWLAAGSIAAHAQTGSPCLDPLADINGSGLTDVLDVQCVIVVSLWELNGSTGPLPTCLLGAPTDIADIDCNGTVNVSDVVLSVNNIFTTALDPAIDPNGDGCPDACQGITTRARPSFVVGTGTDGTGTVRVRSVGLAPAAWGAGVTGTTTVRPMVPGPQ